MFLHKYQSDTSLQSGPALFFRDYATVKTPQHLLSKFNTSLSKIKLYAVHYACLSYKAQLKEQQKWKDECVYCIPEDHYSIPMMSSTIKEMEISGFQFLLLRSKQQYQEAGKQLHNCLGNWKPSANPVFVAKYSNEYVAAIEVYDNRAVVQVQREHNLPAEDDSQFYDAFTIWAEKNHLATSISLSDDNDNVEDALLNLLSRVGF